MRSGLLIALIGLWLLLRTVRRGAPEPGHPHGRNLVDRILGKDPKS